MLVSVLAFTANVLLVRALGAMQVDNVWLIVCARFVVGLALIVAVYRVEFQPTHLWKKPKLIERGLVGGLATYLTYLTVIKLGAGRAVFIGNTYVIWGALLAAWILREPLQRSVITGSVTALIGLALLTNIVATTAAPGVYDFVAVGTAWMSAYVVVTIRQLHSTEHTSTIFAAQCVYGLLLCSGPAVATWQPIPAVAWPVLVLASALAGVGQLTLTRAFRDLPVGEGSLLQMLVPVGIAAGGMVFFGERFHAHEFLGAGLILAGTAFTAWRK